MSKQRLANLDLLRIVLMMMIVSLHYFGHGGGRNAGSELLVNDILINGISTLCWAAVNTFFMLSGFLTREREDQITLKYCFQRCSKIWFKVFAVSLLIYVIALSIGWIEFTPNFLFRAFCPIFSNQYWFITVFLLLTAIWPIIVKGFSRLTDKEIWLLTGVLFLFDSIQPTIGNNGFGEYGVGFLHAFTCMTTGYALKRSSNMLSSKKWLPLLIYIGSCLAMIVIAYYEKRVLGKQEAVIMYYNAPFCITAAAGLLMFFNSLDVRMPVISKIAPYALGIYLVNDHLLVRANAWEKVLHCSNYYNSPYMILHYLGCLFGFMIVGIIADRLISALWQSITREKTKYA